MGIPFATHLRDPSNKSSQGTTAMFDNLTCRNDMSLVMRRLAQFLQIAEGVIRNTTCDKIMPVMIMALREMGNMSTILELGGFRLSPTDGEVARNAPSEGMRYAQGESRGDFI